MKGLLAILVGAAGLLTLFAAVASAEEPKKLPSVQVAPGVVVGPQPPVGNPGDKVTVSPAIIRPQMPPGTPNPPQNPSQVPPPGVPGVTVTIPIKP